MKQETYTIEGSNGRSVLLDITYDADKDKRPVVLYAHGFNGFKDWGNFDLIVTQFVTAGFTFVKFNFSHNGTTTEQPQDFADLEAFGGNNYTKQLFDLDKVLDWVCAEGNPVSRYIDSDRVGLIGHSMGGGISIIKTAEDHRIKALCTWASIAVCKTPWGSWDEVKMKEWEATGVQYYTNGRTGQQMPLYYQLFLDYVNHEDRLDIVAAAGKIKVPFLICHGTEDTGVAVANAYLLQKANPDAEIFIVSSDHVFGRKHPWPESHLPEAMQSVVDRNVLFFQQSLEH